MKKIEGKEKTEMTKKNLSDEKMEFHGCLRYLKEHLSSKLYSLFRSKGGWQ